MDDEFEKLAEAWRTGWELQRRDQAGPPYHFGGHPVGTSALRRLVDRNGWGGVEFMLRFRGEDVPDGCRWVEVDEHEAIGFVAGGVRS